MTEWIDLTRTDDPRDEVHRAVACLAQGGVVGLPTEAAYALAASALLAGAVERLRTARGPDGDRPLPLALRGADELADWVPRLSPLALRLARRAWPGPVTLLLNGHEAGGLTARLPREVARAVAPGATIAFRSPAHDVVREILQLVPGPILLAGARRDGQPSATTASPLADLTGLNMVLDDGPAPLAWPSTVVHVDEQGWKVVRPGAISEAELTRLAATMVLFVCTGNTCRSPMAEALCKARLAHRLGCAVDELEGRGFAVLSAGMGAIDGMPAATNAIEVVRGRGGSLLQHASRRVTPELIQAADLIVTMTADHRDALIAHYPEAAGRTRLLDPTGEDVDDPIGADLDTYRRTARAIEGHLDRLLDDLGRDAGSGVS